MTLHDDRAFYDRCAELLGVSHDFAPFRLGQRSRWNNRKPGSGRFAGRGLVRAFGNHVHLSLYRPRPINRLFDSREAALRCLEELCRTTPPGPAVRRREPQRDKAPARSVAPR